MESLGVALVVIAVLIVNIPAVMAQWREDRPGFIKTLWLAGAYALYTGIGIWLLLGVMAPVGEKGVHVLFAIGFILLWILYGGLTLLRVVPRYREPPRWLMHFGALDVVLLVLLFGSAVGALFLD